MCVYGGIAGGACQILTIAVGDVLTGLWVAESLRQPKINYVDVVLLLANTDQEIVWLDVAMQEVT